MRIASDGDFDCHEPNLNQRSTGQQFENRRRAGSSKHPADRPNFCYLALCLLRVNGAFVQDYFVFARIATRPLKAQGSRPSDALRNGPLGPLRRFDRRLQCDQLISRGPRRLHHIVRR
jgi:hypothetical protein